MNYKEIISHAAACRVLGKDPAPSATTDQVITDVFDAFNKISAFVPDFEKSQQKKWRPFFLVTASGLRFDYSGYGASGSVTNVGSRLCNYVSSEEEADFIGRTFEDLFRTHYYGRPEIQTANNSIKVGEKTNGGFFWGLVHNLIAHPLLVTRARWADRFHDWTAKRM